MRCGILKQFERRLMRGAAILLVGGLAAGCSSDVSRFKDSLFTGTSHRTGPAVSAPENQPYPGDSYQTASVDRTYTGSVARRAVRPQALVGEGGGQTGYTPGEPGQTAAAPVADIRRQPIGQPGDVTSSGLPAPAASAAPRVDDTVTGTTPRAQTPAPQPVADRPAGWGGGTGNEITVREGETVYNLSRRYGVPADAIVAANGLADASDLRAGQKLVIPTYSYSTSAPVSAPDSNPNVAKAKATTEAPASPAPERDSKPADKVAVLPQNPRTGNEAPQAKSDKPASAGVDSGTYTVVSGDTLYGISKKTGVAVDRIKAANGLSNGLIQIGQKLRIPEAGGESTRVASAEPETVDPTVTGNTGQSDAEEVRQVSAYTPPKKDEVAEEANSVEVASAPAPESTGIGRLRWPARGRVISDFGSAPGSPSSDGIDIAVPSGTPVKAAENGVVIYAGDGLKEFGNTVLVRHDDGLVTVYGHASELKVKRGDNVTRGQEIAMSGMSGKADRPKLHFEVRQDSAPVDPRKFLDE